MDFAELAIRASAALGQVDAPEDLALALGQRIQHFLVDEFQDTSYTQFELIEKLTAGWEPGDGRTLFLVGDPMQSIYRFRQADVSLFLKARSGRHWRDPIGAADAERELSFAAGNCGVGEPDIRSDSAGERRSGIRRRGLFGERPRRRRHGRGDRHPRVSRTAAREADRVIELIRAEGDGSVAVLVRSRAHLIEIVNALKRHRIAFQAIEIDQLGERQVVEDLMALTFALLHAADRVSWLAILRAPWCGLTLDDLHALAAPDHHATIWDLLHRPPRALSEDGRARIQRILPVLEQAIAERGRRPLRDWVESTWLRLGGPACVEDETALEDAAAYFDLLEGLAEGADLADFEWFREQVNALFAQPERERGRSVAAHDHPQGQGTGVRHGDPARSGCVLRAPTISDCCSGWSIAASFCLRRSRESGGEKDPIYRYLASIERRKSDQETARLLYVAATRARAQPAFAGIGEDQRGRHDGEPDSRSFLKLLWPMVAEQFANPAQRLCRTNQRNAVQNHPPLACDLACSVRASAGEVGASADRASQPPRSRVRMGQ